SFVVGGHFVLLDILLFGPRRSHSSAPARGSRRPARGAAVKDGPLGPPQGLVLYGREPPRRPGRGGLGNKLLLVIDRREIADRGVAPSPIVEAFDEGEDRRACLASVPESASSEQLALKRREEALAHGIIVGVSDRAHRGAHACLSAALPERDRRVLR